MHEGDPAAAVASTGTSDAQRLTETCHDMRQALGSVFALAGAALAEPELPDNARARLEQIVGQAQWLADIIQDFLRESQRPRTGTPLADLVALAEEAVGTERVTYPGELEVSWPDTPILISGNRVTVRRIIANLLSNATRAAGPQGRVRIEIGYDQGWALLVIDDSGPGFGRIEEGGGLGLRAVARSVDGSAGRIEYGRGSLGGAGVRLWLPLPDGDPSPSLA